MAGDFPFSYRVILLLSLMLIIAGVDRFRHGKSATKYKEYAFIVLTGGIGCIVGFLNDWVTSSISPEYFVLGKGLTEGEGLRLEAGLYGLKTGFSAGVIGGALCLFVCGSRFALAQALRLLWIPVAGAIVTGVALPLLFSRFDPTGIAQQLKELAGSEQINRFRLVWWIHTGLYAGLIVGLGAMIRSMRKGKGVADQQASQQLEAE